MRSKLLRWVLVLGILAFVGTARADTVTIDGSYSFSSNGYGIPPYGGTLNGHHEAFYCVDFASTIAPPYSWQVNVTSLTGSDFSSTKLWKTLGTGAQTAYLEMAWLITQMMGTTDKLKIAQDQFAIWSFTGGKDPFGTNANLVKAALAAVKAGFTGQGFEILSPTGTFGQEFLILTPEPSELLLLGMGLVVIVLLRRKLLVASARETTLHP